ncbi:ABC transporter substrate-binding protein [Subtercola boreus]|uniref:Peptide ABC transporter substrate-binding protein n=1 Tax=Subtercola boreus TaxID=120213 RepID=A0A3E0W8V3_9MICO|nr:ABC transporter substrate-binding protein [Subtercola boreus]RFA19022.1 peptide ABC transporter substrate-binding protein [Subtercola boreus]RFA19160.1 peptide ABC transporter substrate-binding protein [Subtercola boreus]RFA25622.1 peptide ABC transporter substrate-binding protein [Subtercola boreus]
MRRRTLPLFASLALAALLAGCTSTPASTSSTPVAGGKLVYASGDAEPTCLDPHVGGNYPQALVATQYLESLVSKDTSGKNIPWLADSWVTADDGLSVTFTLKSGVTFTDGTPFDAAAVAANVAHIQNPATGSSTGYLALQKVAKVEAVDARTARFDLSEPDSALLDSLSQPWLAMESPTAIARPQADNCASPVGTGPFVVTKWNRQQSIILTRNDAYTSPPADAGHTGAAYLDEIDWTFLPDPASRFAALQTGSVDMIDNVQPDILSQAASNNTLLAIDAPRPGASNRIELNSSKAPFDDAKVREAFIRSSDVDSGVKSLFFGTATRSYSALSSVEPDAVSEPDLFTYDQAAAASLLDAAGWTARNSEGYRTKDGQVLELAFPVSTNQSIPAEQSLFEQIQATSKEAGFKVDLAPLDLSSWYAALGTNDYNLVSAPYTKVGPDVLRILFDSSGTVRAPSGYFANHAQVKNPALDDLLTRAAQSTDADQRSSFYADAQKIVLEGFYILPLYDQQNHFLLRSAVQGVRALPTVSTPTLYDAWVQR